MLNVCTVLLEGGPTLNDQANLEAGSSAATLSKSKAVKATDVRRLWYSVPAAPLGQD